MYIFFMYLCGRRLFNCFWTIQIMYSADYLIIMFYINYKYIHYVCRAGSGMRNIPEHACVRPISKKSAEKPRASTVFSAIFCWHGSLPSRSFIACNLGVEVVVVGSSFGCKCDSCSWVLVCISSNHILYIAAPYNSSLLKWNHMIFNKLKHW